MENLSKLTIDDSCSSMYFSFNSTTAYKTVEAMESCGGTCSLLVEEENDQNNTLEADEKADAVEHLQTVKKVSLGASPNLKNIPKHVLMAYRAISSTPTKEQLLRSVEVTRGSGALDVRELGLAFLDAPKDCISEVLSEDKENQPQESHSQEIYSETSSEIVVSVIEKTQDEDKPEKRVCFSNLPLPLRSSAPRNIRCTPKVRRSMPRCEPDLATNRPSRIAQGRPSITAKNTNQTAKDNKDDDIPKLLNSILKISKDLPPSKSQEKPFNLIGKATRMSIVKTTLNSPARKASRKSIASVQIGKIPSLAPANKRKSLAPSSTAAARRSVMPGNMRKSMLPTTVTSPKKRIPPMNSRKSVLPQNPTTSSMIPAARKSIAPKPAVSQPQEGQSSLAKAKKPPSGLKEDFVCEVCSRKFRVLSLFEAHKRSHNLAATSSKQSLSGDDKQCRYCDKKFAIAKALSNHLVEKCTKIPPGDKKKLLFPSDQPQPVTGASQTKMPQKSLSNLSSCDSVTSTSSQHTRGNPDNGGDGSMPPPSSHIIKKKLAHSGVYCTPKKQLACHVCKISFSNILAFTEHSLAHSAAGHDVSSTTESTQTQTIMKTDGTQTANEDINLQ